MKASDFTPDLYNEDRPRMTTTTPIDDWADQLSDAMMKPLRQVGLLLAGQIEELQQGFTDQQVYIAALERRIAKLEDRVL